MATNTLTESPVWKHFEEEARRQGEDPVDLVTKYMNECLEVWEDEVLDEEIRGERAIAVTPKMTP